MKHGRIADFLFVGLGTVPAALVLSGLPDLAILFFVPLMIAGCLFGMAEQKLEPPEQSTGSDADLSRIESGAVPIDTHGVTFRKSAARD